MDLREFTEVFRASAAKGGSTALVAEHEICRFYCTAISRSNTGMLDEETFIAMSREVISRTYINVIKIK